MAGVDLGRVAYVPKGVYDAGVTYNRLDVVSYLGSSWVSLINNNIGNTPAEGANWSLVAQKGNTGDQGESIIGPTGETGEPGFSPTIVENADNTNDIYRLDITDKDGTTTTPNLKGQDGVISEDAPADGKTYGRKNEGWSEVPIKTSQLQNDDNVVKDAAYVHTDNNYSDEEKQKVADSLRFKDVTEVTTLTDLPVTNYSIKATLSAASPISFASAPAEGEEYMIDILNSGSDDFDQPLPNADNCQSNETSVTCPAGKVTAISVRYIHSKYVFRV
ncbi:hypothetical protein [Parabacteroides provencensis]|uniref:hypothetical protein n=1 Tax=Parabacteroides provencensis TaxID=1944636 RepID=UPI000C14C0E4|nr:hypothetical protein [Parabacteroides provencensis]